MRTTVDLPDPLFRELKAQAARRGTKMKELLTAFVEAGLHGYSAQTTAGRSRSPLPVARRATGKPIPSLTNAQIQSILDDDDARRFR